MQTRANAEHRRAVNALNVSITHVEQLMSRIRDENAPFAIRQSVATSAQELNDCILRIECSDPVREASQGYSMFLRLIAMRVRATSTDDPLVTENLQSLSDYCLRTADDILALL